MHLTEFFTFSSSLIKKDCGNLTSLLLNKSTFAKCELEMVTHPWGLNDHWYTILTSWPNSKEKQSWHEKREIHFSGACFATGNAPIRNRAFHFFFASGSGTLVYFWYDTVTTLKIPQTSWSIGISILTSSISSWSHSRLRWKWKKKNRSL